MIDEVQRRAKKRKDKILVIRAAINIIMNNEMLRRQTSCSSLELV